MANTVNFSDNFMAVLQAVFNFLDTQNFRRTCSTLLQEFDDFNKILNYMNIIDAEQTNQKSADGSYVHLEEISDSDIPLESLYLNNFTQVVPKYETPNQSSQELVRPCHRCKFSETEPMKRSLDYQPYETNIGDESKYTNEERVYQMCHSDTSNNNSSSTEPTIKPNNGEDRFKHRRSKNGKYSSKCHSFHKYSVLKEQFLELEKEHDRLMCIIGQLLSALQQNMLGQSKNIRVILENCRQIYPSLFQEVVL